MRWIVGTVFFMYSFLPSVSFAQATHPPTDAEILKKLFSSTSHRLLLSHSPLMGKSIRISESHSYPLSPQTREMLETILTSLGKTITEDSTKTDGILTVSITHARIQFLPNSTHEYTRIVEMTTHLLCTNNSGTVLFASGLSDRYSDEVDARFFRITDDGNKFCSTNERNLIGLNHRPLMITSFFTTLGILAYFAFQ